jgi:hypothetical protein
MRTVVREALVKWLHTLPLLARQVGRVGLVNRLDLGARVIAR